MAIVVPTDIVSDVLKAGDPVAARAATERLTRLQSSAESEFQAETSAVGEARSADNAAAPHGLLFPGDAPAMSRPTTNGDVPGASYRKFEAFILQTFMESMLPRNDQLFGKGTAGNMWRSMLAEQLGTQLANVGGIGIARMLAKAHPAGVPAATDDGT